MKLHLNLSLTALFVGSVFLTPLQADTISSSAATSSTTTATTTNTKTTQDKSKKESKKMSEKIVTTESGLKYEDIKIGTGPSPKAGQTVTVHYTGTLADGKKFDSSVDRGQPFQFTIGVGQVIKGWDEGVMTMKVGGKRRLIIPYQLGYGDRGFPGAIPPKAELHFDVELLDVK